MDIKTVAEIYQFNGLFTAVILASIFIVFAHLKDIECHLKLCANTGMLELQILGLDNRFDDVMLMENEKSNKCAHQEH